MILPYRLIWDDLFTLEPVQELEPKLLDLQSAGSAGITASTKTLSITVRRSTQRN